MKISKIINKTAVRSNHSLDSGPQARAGLRHGAMVSLLKDPITSLIFWIRSLFLLRDFAMTHCSDSPHSK